MISNDGMITSFAFLDWLSFPNYFYHSSCLYFLVFLLFFYSFHSLTMLLAKLMYWIVTAGILFYIFHLYFITSGIITPIFPLFCSIYLLIFALRIDFYLAAFDLFLLEILGLWFGGWMVWLLAIELWSSSSKLSSSYSQSELSLSLGCKVLVCRSGSRSSSESISDESLLSSSTYLGMILWFYLFLN